MAKVLVGYITKTDTTKEIAEKIAAVLIMKGIDAQARGFQDVENPEDYEVIIAGAPINGMRVVPELTDYLKARPEAVQRVNAVFAVSYMVKHARKAWQNSIRKSLQSIKDEYNAEHSAVFGGRVAEEMPGFARFIFGLPKGMPKDTRDWAEIEAWAKKLYVE
ncbi:MAG: flavodoxin domain-containing protein [Spirochaetia bacterium]